jgi:hypothetical protein
VGVIIAAAGFSMPTAALSQSVSTDRASEIIKDTAESICGTVKQEGSQSTVDINGKVSADANLSLGGILKGLIGKLVEAGASISATVKSEAYHGVLRDQTPSVINNNTNCRLAVVNFLASRVLTQLSFQKLRLAHKNPGTNIEVDHSMFLNNGAVFSVPPGINVCLVDSTLIGNNKIIDIK